MTSGMTAFERRLKRAIRIAIMAQKAIVRRWWLPGFGVTIIVKVVPRGVPES